MQYPPVIFFTRAQDALHVVARWTWLGCEDKIHVSSPYDKCWLLMLHTQ